MTVYAGPILLDGDPQVLGAVIRDGQTHFRVWAPRARSVDVVIKSPTPGGCIAQAWSVAEVLRAWIATRPEKS